MVNTLTYIIQVCSWFVPLYLLYLFLFKHYTFHHWNRWYLLLMGVASFGFPFIHYTIIDNETVFTVVKNTEAMPKSFVEKENSSITDIISNTVDAQPQSWHWLQIVAAIYLIGVAFTGAKLLYGLFNIRRIIERARQSWNSNIAMVFTTDAVPHSSFFSYIFINKKTKTDGDLDKIIYHEMQHNEKLHTVDVLWCEILKVVMWFNPVVYWYKKSLQEIHEFEVDVEMTKLYNKESYAQLLLKVASLNINKLISAFSSTPLKTRIMMLFNPKTYPLKKLAFLLTVPVIAVLLMAYGNVKHKTITTIRTINKPITLVIDAGHGGNDAGVVYGQYSESALNLTIAKKLEIAAGEVGYNVVLTRNSDSTFSLKERSEYINSQNANAFISIHVNGSMNKSLKGIEAYISNRTDADSVSAPLAQLVLSQLAELKGITTKAQPQKRTTSIWVLKNSAIPSVLLELGYLSNSTDLQYITNEANQDAMVAKIILGLNNYFSNNTK